MVNTHNTDKLISHRNKGMQLLNVMASGFLSPLEAFLTHSASEEDCKICFIFGPPRCGSTLLFEFMADSLQCAHFTNAAERLYRVPVATTWLLGSRIKQRNATYNSKYGQLSGMTAPSENGRIWRNWLPQAAPYFIDAPPLPSKNLRKKISAMCNCIGSPMVVKYMLIQPDIPLLLEYFPNAVFIHMERDPAENVRSILRRRRASPGGDTKWWSTRPQGWEKFADKDPISQVCGQVFLCHREIEKHLKAISDSGRHIKVNYKTLCESPEETLTHIIQLFSQNGMHAAKKIARPKAFQASPTAMLSNAEENKILECLQQIANEV